RPEAGSPYAVVLSETELLYPAAPRSPTATLLATLLDPDAFIEVARFDRPVTVLGLALEEPLPPAGTWYSPAATARLRDRRLPHDLKYLNPAVLVLEPADAPY